MWWSNSKILRNTRTKTKCVDLAEDPFNEYGRIIGLVLVILPEWPKIERNKEDARMKTTDTHVTKARTRPAKQGLDVIQGQVWHDKTIQVADREAWKISWTRFFTKVYQNRLKKKTTSEVTLVMYINIYRYIFITSSIHLKSST